MTGSGHATIHDNFGICHDVVIMGIIHNTSLFTLTTIPSSLTPHPSNIMYLLGRDARILWHQWLCHVHMYHLCSLHTHIYSIPKLALPHDTEGCDTCWTCKLRNAARGNGDTHCDAMVLPWILASLYNAPMTFFDTKILTFSILRWLI
jgi:hypothetical protein